MSQFTIEFIKAINFIDVSVGLEVAVGAFFEACEIPGQSIVINSAQNR